MHPATFIPVVGLFTWSAASKMSQLTLTFDDQGIVRHIQTGQTQATSGAPHHNPTMQEIDLTKKRSTLKPPKKATA